MGAPAVDPVKAAQAMNLGDLGYSSTAIANQTGLNDRTIRDIIRRHGRWSEVSDKPVFTALRQEQNKVLESAYRAGAAQLFEKAFEKEKLDKASTYQLVVASSIAIDKARLLAGESTENIAHAHVHDVSNLDELLGQLASLTGNRNQIDGRVPSEAIQVLSQDTRATIAVEVDNKQRDTQQNKRRGRGKGKPKA